MANSLIFTKNPTTGAKTPVSTPVTGDAQPGEPGLPTTSQQMAFNGTDWDRVVTTVAEVSGGGGQNALTVAANLRASSNASWYPLIAWLNTNKTVNIGIRSLLTLAHPYLWNGAAYERLSAPSKFNTGKFTAAGSSLLWTPAAGKKFRLMRLQVDVTGGVTAASAGDLDIVCYDGATATPIALSAYVPTTVTGNAWSSGWIDLANGILSAAADNVLNVNLSFALTAGVVRVTVAGIEE